MESIVNLTNLQELNLANNVRYDDKGEPIPGSGLTGAWMIQLIPNTTDAGFAR